MKTERPNVLEFAAAMGLDLAGLVAYLRPRMADAATQTGLEGSGAVGSGSRRGSPLSASPPAAIGQGKTGSDQASLSSRSVPASEPEVRERRKGKAMKKAVTLEEEGPSETGVLTGLEGLTGSGTGYDPMLGSNNLLSQGLLKSLNL